jgi:hypothetical protein
MYKTTFHAVIGMWVASALVSLGAAAGIIYLVIHFVRKFW